MKKIIPIILVLTIAACAAPRAEEVVLDGAERAARDGRWESAYLQLEDWLTDCNGAIRARAALLYHRYPEIQQAARDSFGQAALGETRKAWGSAAQSRLAGRLAAYATVASPQHLAAAQAVAGVAPSAVENCGR